jgi:hypothetical protein
VIYNRSLTADEVKELHKNNLLVEFDPDGGSDVPALRAAYGTTLEVTVDDGLPQRK